MKTAAIAKPSVTTVSLAVVSLLSWCVCMADAFAPSVVGLIAGSPLPPHSNTMMYASSRNNEQSPSRADSSTRREIFQGALSVYLLATPSVSSARNLPDSTGADLSKVGSIDALFPIVAIQRSLSSAKLQLSDSSGGPSSTATPGTCTIILQSLLKSIPREEMTFKRIFDSYSTPVSYKQKFLDQNAFLVYYTKGYDGPGRPNIEEDINDIQTLQYGARNDAWAVMDDLFVELEFGQGAKNDDSTLSSKEELVALIGKVLVALDSYLSLAPGADVEEARHQLG